MRRITRTTFQLRERGIRLESEVMSVGPNFSQLDPNQTIVTTASGVDNVDPIGSDSRTETLPTGPTGTDRMAGITQTQRITPIGASNQDRPPGHDRSSPPDRTSVPDRTTIPDRTGARVWNRPGKKASRRRPNLTSVS
ncbi:hypothetical protein DY000_02008074 [Brassica cretica]|uniref:Uncharacterized protein n=1 Tax=Brassica cretica TaxID=69181 RepID=A0ABQ7BU76_BRACR|nr:hypothetical protein DY000_02008074 [Brassica cretica]